MKVSILSALLFFLPFSFAQQNKAFKSEGKSHFVGRECGKDTLKKDLKTQSRVEAFKNASYHCRPRQAVRVSPWEQEAHKNDSRFGCDMSGSAAAKFQCL
jgi:hypothetical protein